MCGSIAPFLFLRREPPHICRTRVNRMRRIIRTMSGWHYSQTRPIFSGPCYHTPTTIHSPSIVVFWQKFYGRFPPPKEGPLPRAPGSSFFLHSFLEKKRPEKKIHFRGSIGNLRWAAGEALNARRTMAARISPPGAANSRLTFLLFAFLSRLFLGKV